MNRRESFDDALDAAIDQIRGGSPLADVLATHPHHARELQSALEISQVVASSARESARPMPEALAGNFSIVRAALERERMAQDAVPQHRGARPAPWWQRRWSIASLSLPAAVVVAAMFAGAGGAAAATVAVANTDVGARVIAAVTPDWANNVVPSVFNVGQDDDGEEALNPNAPNVGDQTSESGQGAHPAITVTGTIGDAQGNTFTLASGDGEWKVQYDANTELSGAIVEGAGATVTGAQTGEQALHGTQISTDAPGAPDEERGPGTGSGSGSSSDPPVGPDANSGNPPEDPGTENNGSTPGASSSDRTPPLGKPTPTATPDAASEQEQGTSDTGPPGQGMSPSGSGSGQPNENAGENSAGANETMSDGNGGGPKEP